VKVGARQNIPTLQTVKEIVTEDQSEVTGQWRMPSGEEHRKAVGGKSARCV